MIVSHKTVIKLFNSYALFHDVFITFLDLGYLDFKWRAVLG